MNQFDTYGGFRTHTFAQVFNSAESFLEAYKNCGITPIIKDESINLLFYLLYGQYGNSHIANEIDENQFVYKLFSIVFMYGPTWEKRLEIQKALRELKFDDSENGIFRGGKVIYNHAKNPGTSPTTATLQELQHVNEQNTSNFKKSPLEGFSILASLLETDVTKEFLTRFSKLFKKFVAPNYPLFYVTQEDIND